MRIQLCLTLASLLLRSEGDPTQAVSDALTCLRGSRALLEFASQLPEEWSSDSCKVSPAGRELGMAALRDSTAGGLFPLLHEEYSQAALPSIVLSNTAINITHDYEVAFIVNAPRPQTMIRAYP